MRSGNDESWKPDIDIPARKPAREPSSLSVMVRRLPLRHVAAGLILMSGLILLDPNLPAIFRCYSISLLTASLTALSCGGLLRNRRIGRRIGRVLTIFFAAGWVSLINMPGYSFQAGFTSPLLGLLLLIPLPVLLGFAGGLFAHERERRTDWEFQGHKQRWNFSILLLCSISLTLLVGFHTPQSRSLPFTAPFAPRPVGTLSGTFERLDMIPRPALCKSVQPWMNWIHSISPEGDAISGQLGIGIVDAHQSIYTQHGFVWTEKSGLIDVAQTLPPPYDTDATSVYDMIGTSPDGQTRLLRWSGPSHMGEWLWTAERGVHSSLKQDVATWVRQTTPRHYSQSIDPETFGSLLGVSTDGKKVLTYYGNSTQWWSEEKGFERVPGLEGPPSVRAITEQGDFAGLAGAFSFTWTHARGMQKLPRLPETTGSVAYGLSSDGRIAVGASGNHLVRWTEGGKAEDLGVLPGYVAASGPIEPNSFSAVLEWTGYTVSDDGSVIAGQSANIPFVWTKETGVVPVHEILSHYQTENETNLAVQKVAAVAVSHDGKRITGFSVGPDTAMCRWRLTLQ